MTKAILAPLSTATNLNYISNIVLFPVLQFERWMKEKYLKLLNFTYSSLKI